MPVAAATTGATGGSAAGSTGGTGGAGRTGGAGHSGRARRAWVPGLFPRIAVEQVATAVRATTIGIPAVRIAAAVRVLGAPLSGRAVPSGAVSGRALPRALAVALSIALAIALAGRTLAVRTLTVRTLSGRALPVALPRTALSGRGLAEPATPRGIARGSPGRTARTARRTARPGSVPCPGIPAVPLAPRCPPVVVATGPPTAATVCPPGAGRATRGRVGAIGAVGVVRRAFVVVGIVRLIPVVRGPRRHGLCPRSAFVSAWSAGDRTGTRSLSSTRLRPCAGGVAVALAHRLPEHTTW